MKFFTVWFCTICCCIQLMALSHRNHQLMPDHFTQEDGLANNTLFTIHQDQKGFLWIGTDVGISRYDGVHFHNYELMDVEPQAVQRICEMKQDSLLWLELGRYHHIACFDKTNGEYIQLESPVEGFLTDIYDICVADSVLYAITSRGVEVLNYHRKDNAILIEPKTIVTHKYSLRKIERDDEFLYVLDDGNNILIYNYHTKEHHVLSFDRLDTDKMVESIHALNGCLWITARWNGVYCYQPKNDQLRKLDLKEDIWANISISDIVMKNETTFIAATPHSLLYIIFSGTDYIQDEIATYQIKFDNFMYNSYVKNRITQMYVDKKNAVVWLCTFGKGLLKSNMTDDDIIRIPLQNQTDINGLAEDAKGHIWLTTEHHGVWRSTSNHLSDQTKFERWERSSSNGYYCIYKGENGFLWIADEMGTIYLINPLTNHIQTLQPKYDGVNPIKDIRNIYLCVHNKLWIVTDSGLFIYDHQADKCLAYMGYNESIFKITSMCEDHDGFMWLGTNDGIRIVTLKGNQIELSNGREQKAGVSKSEVLNIYMNRYNEMYISYEDKLLQTDGQHEDMIDIKILQKDMVSGHIECIIDDKGGNTWLGNNTGIMTINNRTKASYTYPFPERFYNVCQLNDGRLLWSNSSGLMCFDPRVLKQRSSSAPLCISDIGVNYNMVEIGEKINGQVILEKPVYQLDKLLLKHSNNSVIFYLTNLHYNQMPNKIEYRLLPIQPDWQKTYKTEIEYSDLASGNYSLEVRPISINDEEVETTKIDIQIKKHWAVTPFAFVCYLLLASLFAALTWYYSRAKASRKLFYKKKEELLKSTLAEEIKGRKEEKIIQRLRNQSRYSLARELRTPLSLVVAPLKEMIGASIMPSVLLAKAKVAYRNTIGMQDVCNLMLDIYEQEDKEMQLNVAPYPVSNIINSAIFASNELLNVAPIKLHYDKDTNIKKEIWVDRKKIEYILRNIFSNAYRHISYSGNIKVNTFLKTVEGKEYYCYQVQDDGKSMIEKSAVYLLSKEEGGNELTSQLHAELGIILMKEYITAHHGEIQIEQNAETGTCVTVYIPLGKKHFEEDTNVTFIDPKTIQAEQEESQPIVTAAEKEQQLKEEQETMSLLAPATNGKYKMLVIEDHKDIRLYLKVLFSSEYTIVMAENGEEGVKAARREMPDIILTDIMMPVMDGFEVTRQLKEDLKTCHIPIVMLTALAGDTNAVKGLDYGADDYILKPFNAEILRSKVKRLIENRQNLKQAYMKLMMASNAKESDEEQEEGGQKEDPFIKQIFEIVENNLQNPDFNVKRLAEMVNMSQPTLYRRVKMLTNYTIIELIRGVRLRNAAELLRSKKYSIQEVSEMVGYNDAPTFRKHFVDFYGTTPSNYANQKD